MTESIPPSPPIPPPPPPAPPPDDERELILSSFERTINALTELIKEMRAERETLRDLKIVVIASAGVLAIMIALSALASVAVLNKVGKKVEVVAERTKSSTVTESRIEALEKTDAEMLEKMKKTTKKR